MDGSDRIGFAAGSSREVDQVAARQPLYVPMRLAGDGGYLLQVYQFKR
jgi:hypothetical protein